MYQRDTNNINDGMNNDGEHSSTTTKKQKQNDNNNNSSSSKKQKKESKRLRRDSDRLDFQQHITETITNNVSSCLFMMDKRGFPTYLNPAAERITG